MDAGPLSPKRCDRDRMHELARGLTHAQFFLKPERRSAPFYKGAFHAKSKLGEPGGAATPARFCQWSWCKAVCLAWDAALHVRRSRWSSRHATHLPYLRQPRPAHARGRFSPPRWFHGVRTMSAPTTGQQLALVGLEDAADHADRAKDGQWSAKAWEFFEQWGKAHAGRPFQAEAVRIASRGQVPQASDPRAWGSIVLRAESAGLIRRVGYRPQSSPSCHGSPKAVWVWGASQ